MILLTLGAHNLAQLMMSADPHPASVAAIPRIQSLAKPAPKRHSFPSDKPAEGRNS